MPSHNDRAQLTELPADIVQQIALFLDPSSIFQMTLVSHSLLHVLSEPGFLVALIKNHSGFVEERPGEPLKFSDYSHRVLYDDCGSDRMANLFFAVRYLTLKEIEALDVSQQELWSVDHKGESLLSVARARNDQTIVEYLWQCYKAPKAVSNKVKQVALHQTLDPKLFPNTIDNTSDHFFRAAVYERNVAAILQWFVLEKAHPHTSGAFYDKLFAAFPGFLNRTASHLLSVNPLLYLFKDQKWCGKAVEHELALCVLLRKQPELSRLRLGTSDLMACAHLAAWCGNELALGWFLDNMQAGTIRKIVASELICAQPTSRECAVVLLRQGADINAQNAESETALLHAIKTNQAALVRYLLEQGACASKPLGNPAKLPLHWAIDELQCDALRALLDTGVTVSDADAVRFIQRLTRCESEEKSRVRYVVPILIHLLGLSSRRDLSQEALYSRLRETLKTHWPENAHSAWNQVSVFNFAASTNDAGLLRLVVTPGLSKTLESTNPTGLCHAAECGSTEAIKLLHELGHDVNAVSPADKRQRSPIVFAINGGTARTWSPDRYAPVIKLLASLGGDPYQRNSRGETPLSLAYKTSPVGLVQALLEALQKCEPSPGDALAEIERVYREYTTTRVGNQRALQAVISALTPPEAGAGAKRSGSAAGLASPAPTRVASSLFHHSQASASSSQSLPSTLRQ
ncbi:MAG: hypothetical protein COV52_06170 [Gammaproteobacteria bacterium CG11_big_fil_rev_8_21_14_0_20_46_22]|nr:MAG: hypothetical protein COW05_07490 [Gammaproteobacteria bacterium CG12_big_fil_rev_8_21_14_0_65_46_12]PIR11088.1 MAG: hypothetical protein COV52_06170 [Gammaproteobacteria bacterium CG11_big_fil_rev_8_21_14_0_20_46_22]